MSGGHYLGQTDQMYGILNTTVASPCIGDRLTPASSAITKVDRPLNQKGNQTRKKHGLLRKNKADVAGHATHQTDQHEVKEESQRVGLDQRSNDKQRRQWCFGQ